MLMNNITVLRDSQEKQFEFVLSDKQVKDPAQIAPANNSNYFLPLAEKSDGILICDAADLVPLATYLTSKSFSWAEVCDILVKILKIYGGTPRRGMISSNVVCEVNWIFYDKTLNDIKMLYLPLAGQKENVQDLQDMLKYIVAIAKYKNDDKNISFVGWAIQKLNSNHFNADKLARQFEEPDIPVLGRVKNINIWIERVFYIVCFAFTGVVIPWLAFYLDWYTTEYTYRSAIYNSVLFIIAAVISLIYTFIKHMLWNNDGTSSKKLMKRKSKQIHDEPESLYDEKQPAKYNTNEQKQPLTNQNDALNKDNYKQKQQATGNIYYQANGQQQNNLLTPTQSGAKFSEGYRLTAISNNKSAVYIDKFPFTVGRMQAKVHYHIEDPSVSGVHARFILKEDRCVAIEDMGSTNGTFVNKQAVASNIAFCLSDNDLVEFAQTGFVFHII